MIAWGEIERRWGLAWERDIEKVGHSMGER